MAKQRVQEMADQLLDGHPIDLAISEDLRQWVSSTGTEITKYAAGAALLFGVQSFVSYLNKRAALDHSKITKEIFPPMIEEVMHIIAPLVDVAVRKVHYGGEVDVEEIIKPKKAEIDRVVDKYMVILHQRMREEVKTDLYGVVEDRITKVLEKVAPQ